VHYFFVGLNNSNNTGFLFLLQVECFQEVHIFECVGLPKFLEQWKQKNKQLACPILLINNVFKLHAVPYKTPLIKVVLQTNLAKT